MTARRLCHLKESYDSGMYSQLSASAEIWSGSSSVLQCGLEAACVAAFDATKSSSAFFFGSELSIGSQLAIGFPERFPGLRERYSRGFLCCGSQTPRAKGFGLQLSQLQRKGYARSQTGNQLQPSVSVVDLSQSSPSGSVLHRHDRHGRF